MLTYIHWFCAALTYIAHERTYAYTQTHAGVRGSQPHLCMYVYAYVCTAKAQHSYLVILQTAWRVIHPELTYTTHTYIHYTYIHTFTYTHALHIYIYTYIHACSTYIHIYIRYIQIFIHTYILTIHTYIRYIHIYIHAYIHTFMQMNIYIQTYKHTQIYVQQRELASFKQHCEWFCVQLT